MKNYDLFDKYYVESFSEYFLSLRKITGKSYTDVASDLGIKPSTFYHYEKGLRECPVSIMKELCNYYGKDIHEVFRVILDRAEKKVDALSHLHIDVTDL